MSGLFGDDVKRRIKEASEILDLVRSYGMELKRAGRNWKACCPFHHEKTPSFNVNPEGQYFKCFGCGKSGDVFSFVMEYERVEFPEALRILAERAGIEVAYDPGAIAQARKDSDWKGYLYKLNAAAASFYKEMLFADEGQGAREYLSGRGISEASWERFGLGFAPVGGTALVNRLQGQKAPAKAVAAAGLAGFRDDGSVYDYFRGRLMFPIADVQNRIIGFGARSLDGSEPKYLNTRETLLFHKGRTIYGLPQARDAIVDARRAVIVEGYTDVIVCHQFGLSHVVACLGTAITTEHLRVLRRLADELDLLTDADEAGARASERSLEILFQEDAEARVVRLDGEAKDPCEFLLASGREAFEEALSRGVPLFEYKFRRVAESHDLASTAGQAAAAKELMELVSLVQDPIRRAGFRRDVAARLNLPESALLFAKARRAEPSAPQPADEAPAPEHALAHAERELLRWVFHQPAWMESTAEEVDLAAFSGAPERLVGRAILEALGDGKLPPRAEHLEAGDASPSGAVAREVLERLPAEDEAARRLCIELAEQPLEHSKLKPGEAYGMRLDAVRKAKMQFELDAAKREESAARAAGDPSRVRAAEQRVSELRLALAALKKGRMAEAGSVR